MVQPHLSHIPFLGVGTLYIRTVQDPRYKVEIKDRIHVQVC